LKKNQGEKKTRKPHFSLLSLSLLLLFSLLNSQTRWPPKPPSRRRSASVPLHPRIRATRTKVKRERGIKHQFLRGAAAADEIRMPTFFETSHRALSPPLLPLLPRLSSLCMRTKLFYRITQKPTKKTNNSQLSRSGPDRPFPPAAADAALCRRSPSPPPCQQGCCRRRSGRSLLLLRGGRAPQASGSAPRPGPTGAGSRGEVQQVEGEAGKDPAGRRRRRVVGRPFGGAQGSSCCSCCCCCCCCCACCCCPRLSAAASTAAAAAAEETDRDPDGTLSENLRHRPYLLEQAPSRKGNGARLRREGAGCFGSRGSRGLCGR